MRNKMFFKATKQISSYVRHLVTQKAPVVRLDHAKWSFTGGGRDQWKISSHQSYIKRFWSHTRDCHLREVQTIVISIDKQNFGILKT